MAEKGTLQLHVYNTLSRKKEPFEPLNPPHVGMYVCGPTVYGDAHLGHAKSYVSFDVVLRYLRYLGYNVRYVQNITDVGHLVDDAEEGEDKLSKQARIEKVQPMEIAEKYTYTYFRDMDALNVLRPDIAPRATGHIPEQIAMVKKLIENGHAYEVNGNVYFDVSSDKEYGKLSGRKTEDAESGTRVETASDKKSPEDFALWKKAEDKHIMKWDSPWGVGYPGWHIECSAMSTKYLGESFDIHGGGLENQFPHHECEIAQAECAHDKDFVKYWLHNNMVTLEGQKMGKSLGNAINLHEFFTGDHKLLTRAWPPEVIRFFLLQSHYRSTTDFSEEALSGAESGLKNLHSMIQTIEQTEPGDGKEFDLKSFKEAFESSMNDDFNSAQAIAILFEKLKEIRKRINDSDVPSNLDEIKVFLHSVVEEVLGIWPKEEAGGDEQLTSDLIELLIEIRKDARANKNFELSDKIRDDLSELGVQLMDGKDGTSFEIDK
ncbi:MAG: cysteine--tRNA ligase [Gracilimonas sp.]|uniref:cysteine--tRNA ligase n=1 Tax=Gracilimonas TaxID=649462 RepID=UPI001B02BE87|nr:cysteine--tRNA ligase [Gracilimonas sp.]MBO6586759.1 cysteine--tRNA ligase [Gracilimonas sp.]MBO6615416.1 cysteine--tRNA ligase [Gracilimonas sp.]